MGYYERIKRFLIVGTSAALVNFLSITILIELLGFQTYLLKNVANILAIEISTLYNFFVSRSWTWGDAPRKEGKSLIAQFISYNLAALTGIAFRALLFPVLEKLGVFYLINVAIGIGMAATLDFILFDKLVFKRRKYQKEVGEKYPG